MSRLVSSVRSAVAKARASAPFGQYLPNNKVLAGALAAGVTLALQQLGVVDIPAAYVSVGAFAVVGYLFPESPVAAAHVVAKAGTVQLNRVTKTTSPVQVGDVTTVLVPGYGKAMQDQSPPTVPPQSA